MKLKKIITLGCVVVAMGLIASCSGEDGEQGIQGEDGAQGIQGEKGDQGEQGIPGADGNANVTKLDFDLSFTPAGESEIPINVPEFTVETLQNNTLITYLEISDNNDTSYFLLPGRVNILQLDFGIEYKEEALAVYVYNADGTTGNWPDIQENVSIILHITMVEMNPDAMAGKNSVADNLKNAGVDIANYLEVMKYYGLE
ncbi:collagen-like protein [Muricauda sp. 334s03]|uniref:Collagen-like protein n=1 Tax=Flagellimonas yonaguniensis TaxID=3031325 RepID=A0ABT5XYF8_9FLAO|nr:collagen-like protein [[Muricauda] yonaguniensis]MDF0716223.1 collagen-like protein [[Muricauda] yonaguniensis]